MKDTILYLHETAFISGAENSLLNLIRNIDRNKFVPVFVLADNGPLAMELMKMGVEVDFVQFPRIRSCRGVLKTIKVLRAIARRREVKIIHSNSIRTHIYGAIAAKLERIPFIWHQRNMLFREIVDLDRIFSFLPDRIICNSNAVARRFRKAGVLPNKVRVVHNGVDTEIFNPYVDPGACRREFQIKEGDFVVGIASRFNVIKGHETFFKAAEIILSRKAHLKDKLKFLVVGGAVFEEDKKREIYLKDLVDRLGLKNNVIFAGLRRDMPEVYAAMSILVLSSLNEACGRVILEAMASGKPVIATNSGGTPEMVEDGITGYLFAPNDSEALAEKITRFIAQPLLLQTMGQDGRIRAKDKFSIAKNVRETERIYLELIGGG